MAIDAAHRRLYGLGDRLVDLDSDRAAATFVLPEHGVLLAPDLGRGIGMDGTIFDLSTLRVIDTVHLSIAGQPDGYTSAYDRATHRALLFRRYAGVIDMRTGRVVDTLDLGGDPAAGVGDDRGRVFVNRARVDSMIVIDAKVPRVVGRWGLGPCGTPSGLAIDKAHRRLFVACETMLVVLDATSGRVVATVPGIRGGQQIAFDPSLGLIFNPNGRKGGATISVIHEDTPDRYHIVETVPTGPDGGRTLAVDPTTHRVYLACGRFTELLTVYVFAPSTTSDRPGPGAVGVGQ